MVYFPNGIATKPIGDFLKKCRFDFSYSTSNVVVVVKRTVRFLGCGFGVPLDLYDVTIPNSQPDFAFAKTFPQTMMMCMGRV